MRHKLFKWRIVAVDRQKIVESRARRWLASDSNTIDANSEASQPSGQNLSSSQNDSKSLPDLKPQNLEPGAKVRAKTKSIRLSGMLRNHEKQSTSVNLPLQSGTKPRTRITGGNKTRSENRQSNSSERPDQHNTVQNTTAARVRVDAQGRIIDPSRGKQLSPSVRGSLAINTTATRVKTDKWGKPVDANANSRENRYPTQSRFSRPSNPQQFSQTGPPVKRNPLEGQRSVPRPASDLR